MKRLLITLLLVVLFFPPVGSARSVVDHTVQSIVRVESLTNAGATSTCTGFMVAPRRALTAVHCVPLDASLTVDGEVSVVIKGDESFALLLAGDKPVLKLGTKLRVQEAVTSFGYAWGRGIIALSRRVSAIDEGDFAVDGPLAPGMSGGPTVNRNGDVVGLNQASNEIIGIACGAGEMREFLANPFRP